MIKGLPWLSRSKPVDPAPAPVTQGPRERKPIEYRVRERRDGFTYNDAPQIDRLVFICGLHRSGTTMLEHLLAREFDVSFLRGKAPENEGQFFQPVYQPARNYGGTGRFAFSPNEAGDLAKLSDYPRHRADILDAWSRYVVGTSGVLLEKSPPNVTKIAWLRKVFPGAKFVLMTRDPRAVSGATLIWAQTSIPELMSHWNAAYSIAMRDFDDADCMITRYEDICDDAARELTRIGDFADLTRIEDGSDRSDRFTTLENSNGKYLDGLEYGSFGRGIWEDFGYSV